MRPVRAKALKLLAIYNAFALTGRQPCEHDNPGRCPGLRASAPSGRAACVLLPWAVSFCPFRTCGAHLWKLSSLQVQLESVLKHRHFSCWYLKQNS